MLAAAQVLRHFQVLAQLTWRARKAVPATLRLPRRAVYYAGSLRQCRYPTTRLTALANMPPAQTSNTTSPTLI